MEPIGPLQVGVEELNRAFLDALEFLNPVIENASKKTKTPFRTLIPSGVFPLGEGVVQKQYRFHGGMGDLAGLTTWRQIEKGRAPGTNGEDDPGFDPCTYTGYKVKHGFDTVDYVGHETVRFTDDICINDIKWNWQFKQQVALIFSYLADVTLNVTENYNQEQYINMARKVVWTDTADGVEFEYSPFDSTELTFPVGTQVSTLSDRHFRYWYELLSLEASAGTLGYSGDMPVFPFILHPLDFDDMLRNDTAIRDDFRYAQPMALIDNYGKIKEWRGTGFMSHLTAPRFRVNRIEGGNVVLERVLPYLEEAAATSGTKIEVNPEYVKAEYALGIYLMKDVFTRLVPPSGPSAPGGGTQFGDTPNWGGDWKWLNFPDRNNNPLGEKGFYFARFQNFAKPGVNYDKAVVVLYKRCPQVCLKVCSPCVAADDQGGAQTVVAGSVTAVDPEGTGSYTRVELTLAGSLLDANAPDAVTVTFVGGSTETAYISKDANAPTYELTFATAADWVANDGGIASVTP